MNHFSLSQLQQIAVSALNFSERLTSPIASRRQLKNQDFYFDYWREAVGNDERSLQAICATVIDNERETKTCLFEVDPENVTIPTWLQELDQLLILSESASQNTITELGDADQVPFMHALWSFVTAASCKLHSTNNTLSDRTVRDLQIILLNDLSEICSRTLGLEFARYKKAHVNLQKEELYKHYCSHLCSSEWVRLFCSYPVMARRFSTVIRQWHEMVNELIDRLTNDQNELAELCNCLPVLPIKASSGALSDRHNQGRRVLCLTSASGVQFGYKPRDIRIEATYNNILVWLDNHSSRTISLKPIKVIAKDRYGWVEWKKHTDCTSQTEVECCFYKLGQHIALLQLLGGGDMHPENVIVQADEPFMIDLEVLFKSWPNINLENANPAETAIAKYFISSVLSTGMLPNWRMENDRLTDISGWSNPELIEVERNTPAWIDCNTDNMKLVAVRTFFSPSHLPSFSLKPCPPSKHTKSIVAGFTEAYQWIKNNKLLLSVLNKPFNQFCDNKSRFIFRNTKVYAKLIARLNDPVRLKCGLLQSLTIHSLYKTMSSTRQQENSAHIIAAECESLEVNDIPRFTYAIDSVDLNSCNCSKIDNVFNTTGIISYESRLKSITQEEIQRQADLITSALTSRHDKSPQLLTAVDSHNDFHSLACAEADRIARLIHKTAIVDGQTVNWLTVIPVDQSGQTNVAAMEPGLYQGLAGLGIFLSAHAQIRNCEESHLLARLLMSQMSIIIHNQQPTKDSFSLGSGLAGTLYAMVTMAKFLGSSHHDLAIHKLTSRFHDEQTWQSTSLDIVEGLAGNMLSVHAASSYLKDVATSQLASKMAERLSKAVADAPVANGFAHGRHGIRAALDRVGFSTFQHQPISIEELGETASIADNSSWCHGTVGHILATHGTPYSNEIAKLAERLAAHAHFPADHICCGEAGLIDFLCSLSVKNERPEFLRLAKKRMAKLTLSAANQGSYRFFLRAPQSMQLGFFTGLSGIGYTILRLLNPKDCPSILNFE